MPRSCTVCGHDGRDAIDKALVTGASFRGLSALYRVSEDAITRHSAKHLPRALVTAQVAQEATRADDLVGDVRKLHAIALNQLAKAAQAGDIRTALAGVREARGCLELLGKLLGELDERPVINLLVAPQWLSIRATLLDVLRPYPEARIAVADRLAVVEAS
jgi:hypothetical protein